MRIRINTNSLKNAIGTVFLLATAFFVCSTFISMRSVFADPITPVVTVSNTSGRVSPRMENTKRPAVVSRVSTKNNIATKASAQKTAVSRGGGNRTVTKRLITPKRVSSGPNRNVVSRNKKTVTTQSNRGVRARTGVKSTRVSAAGSVMAGTRASGMRASGTTTSNTSYTYLASKLYSNTYSNLVDTTTGLISADAYNTCLESYYACMDEICTARSDAKGRCSCAGRARSFLQAEDQLEAANEELIKLSGQLSLLIATKGRGDQLTAAFSLTDAEKVMNCVSYKEKVLGGEMTEKEWYEAHLTFAEDSNSQQTSGMPYYCSESNNTFGFDVKNIDGAGSDILAQLRAWADAKDLAKQYTDDDPTKITFAVSNLSSMIDNTIVSGGTSAELDSLANKWGYQLFEYAHNNVCGRVLDACFNGIFEACGNPGTVTDSDGVTHSKCANSATSNCPYNYNSYIAVEKNGNELTGEIILNERGASNATIANNASCFGYVNSTSTAANNIRTLTSSTSSADPYSTLRGPVADARRSIIQKYLLDANAACDAYGTALQNTAQRINYQKIAAEQSLQQKRLQFKQENDDKMYADAQTAVSNFTNCVDELWDCYKEYESSENWTTARIKSYCSQVSQVPHCYETMICSPLQSPLIAVIDKPDDTSCTFMDNYETNTCRNVVSLSEILYGTGYKPTGSTLLNEAGALEFGATYNSKKIREECLQTTLNCDTDSSAACIRDWKKVSTYTIRYYNGSEELTNVSPVTYTTADVEDGDYTFTPTPRPEERSGWSLKAGCPNGAVSSYITLPQKTMGDKIFYACP